MSYGIRIAAQGRNVSDTSQHARVFDTTTPQLAVKLGQDPSHSDTVAYGFSSNPVVPGSGVAYYPLVTIPHNLEYIPAILAYVYIQTDNAGGGLLPSGSYYPLGLWLVDGDTGCQWLTATADKDNFYITYVVDGDMSAFQVAHGAPGAEDMTGMSFIFKYYIFVNIGA